MKSEELTTRLQEWEYIFNHKNDLLSCKSAPAYPLKFHPLNEEILDTLSIFIDDAFTQVLKTSQIYEIDKDVLITLFTEMACVQTEKLLNNP